MQDGDAKVLWFNEEKCLGLNLSLGIILCVTKDGRFLLLSGILHGSVSGGLYLLLLDLC